MWHFWHLHLDIYDIFSFLHPIFAPIVVPGLKYTSLYKVFTPTDTSSRALVPVRAETLSIYTDWPNTWRLAKLRGLESELSSFLFRLLHHLLPTQERVLRLKGDGGKCLLCNGLEDLVHAFFTCPHSSRAGLALLGWVQVADGELLPEDALTMNLNSDISPDVELAAVYMLATGLKFIWESRVAKKVVTPFLVRAELEAKISLLRRTRLVNTGTIMQGMLEHG